jgi:hypothetical protein
MDNLGAAVSIFNSLAVQCSHELLRTCVCHFTGQGASQPTVHRYRFLIKCDESFYARRLRVSFSTFVDYEKTFDKVKGQKLFNKLKKRIYQICY